MHIPMYVLYNNTKMLVIIKLHIIIDCSTFIIKISHTGSKL